MYDYIVHCTSIIKPPSPHIIGAVFDVNGNNHRSEGAGQ